MTNYWKGILVVFLTIMLSCTEGGQSGQKITQLIESNSIEKITVNLGPRIENRIYLVKDLQIEDQFLKVENDYINLSDLKIIKVKGKELELIIN